MSNPNLLNIAAGNNISTIEFIKTQADAVSSVLEPEAGLSERVKAETIKSMIVLKLA